MQNAKRKMQKKRFLHSAFCIFIAPAALEAIMQNAKRKMQKKRFLHSAFCILHFHRVLVL
jgi:hypothetical protein